jgi:hypothetical protein
MKKLITLLFIAVFSVSFVFAQKAKPTPKPKTPNKVIFAVLNDGKTLEPLAKIENGKLLQTVSGGDDSAILTAFSKTYYAPKTNYNLIFGGNVAGTASVIKNDPKQECSSNMATATVKSAKAKLKGNVMALATNLTPAKAGSGVRRLPTAAERSEIEKLVSAEFTRNGETVKTLKYHNLTAIDVDNDKSIEFVGSYWLATSAKTRALLFFIAEKDKDGYAIGISEFRTVKEEEVMSGEIKAVDEGIYNELFLDYLDYNGDGVGEIFTYVQAFEGAGFNAYQKKNGKWERILEASNYHCGY